MRKNKFFVLLLGVLIIGVLFSGSGSGRTCERTGPTDGFITSHFCSDGTYCKGTNGCRDSARNNVGGSCSPLCGGQVDRKCVDGSNRITNNCRGCYISGDTFSCRDDQACGANSCTTCSSNNDCISGRVCSSGECVIPPSCTISNCNYAECSTSGTKKTGASCSGSCPTRSSQDGISCSSGTGTCSSGVCIPNTKLNTTYWANMRGLPIVNASKGDTVLMIYGGAYLEGKTVWYVPQEYNSSFVWWSFPTWFSKSWNNAAKIAGNAYQPWTIPSENTYKKRFGTLINLNGVDASGGQVWNHSGNLTIDGQDNSVPTIGAILPEDGAKVKVNTSVDFNLSVTDEDDLLKITWDFGDGTSPTIINNHSNYLNSSGANVQHNYTRPGMYKWTLTVEEMNNNNGRNNKNSTQGTIHVLMEGINVFPIISSPEENKFYGHSVQFNASQSYIADCSLDNFEGSEFNVTNDRGEADLYCRYVLAPKSEPIGEYNVSIRWKELKSLTSGEVIDWIRGNETYWEPWTSETYEQDLKEDENDPGNIQGVVIFKKLYRTVGPRRVALDMKIQW